MRRDSDPVGCTVPRLWTRPLVDGPPGPCGCGCALDESTSLGFRFVSFCVAVLGWTPDPWQRWTAIHALETKPDGSLRYRTILLLVARQNGKSALVRALTVWFLFTGRVRFAVSTAQDLGVARRLWEEAVSTAGASDQLRPLIESVRRANGQESMRLANGAEYIIKATTEDAARGLTVDLLVLDELRTHRDVKAWGALTKTTMARPGAVQFAMSNAGSDESIVLNDLRDKAIAQLHAGGSLFLAEYSAPDDCALDDVDAIRQANPSLGNGRLTMAAIDDARATDPPGVYRTEVLCQRVESLSTAVSDEGWKAGLDGVPGMLKGRPDLFACWDVADDGKHVTLVVAAREGHRVRVEVAGAWDSTIEARAEIPELLRKIRPRREVWFPAGPGGALAPIMAGRRRAHALKGDEVTKACMGLADLARIGGVLHPGDPLLTAHVLGTVPQRQGDAWRFARRNGGHCDAAYAAAGAIHMALTFRRTAWESSGETEVLHNPDADEQRSA